MRLRTELITELIHEPCTDAIGIGSLHRNGDWHDLRYRNNESSPSKTNIQHIDKDLPKIKPQTYQTSLGFVFCHGFGLCIVAPSVHQCHIWFQRSAISAATRPNQHRCASHHRKSSNLRPSSRDLLAKKLFQLLKVSVYMESTEEDVSGSDIDAKIER